MKQTFECATCGIVTETRSHLCNPVKLAGQGDYCGQPLGRKTAFMCAEETDRLDYECTKCGRTAEQSELICSPRKVK